MADIKYLKTLEWKPLLEGANDSCLFKANGNGKIYLAGGGLRGGKLQVNIANVIELDTTKPKLTSASLER